MVQGIGVDVLLLSPPPDSSPTEGGGIYFWLNWGRTNEEWTRLFILFAVLFSPVLLWAHGFSGKRFFPATLAVDDPFVSDEGSPAHRLYPEPGEGEKPSAKAAVISGEFSKRVTQNLGISLGLGFRHLRPDGEKSKSGLQNLELGAIRSTPTLLMKRLSPLE